MRKLTGKSSRFQFSGCCWFTAHPARNGIRVLPSDPCSATSASSLPCSIESVGLREIPDRTLRLIVAAAAQNAAARVFVAEILRSTARRCRPCPSRRTGLRRAGCASTASGPRMRAALVRRGHGSSIPLVAPGISPAIACPARRIATPIHAAAACPPTPRRRAHLRAKPRSPACCPSRRDMFRSSNRAGNSDRPADGSGWHRGTS